MSAFPNGSPANAKGYLGALAALLGTYPKTIALKCCDPVRGVARDTRFLPTVADLVAWCEREKAELQGIVDRDDRDTAIERGMAQRAREADAWDAKRTARPTYDELKAKYGPTWGISNPDVKPQQTRQQAEDALIALIGREAFDALPDAKERAPQPQREAAE